MGRAGSHRDWERLRDQLVIRRLVLGLTQEQAAKLAGMKTRKHLSKIESGENVPGAVVLAKLLRGYGLILAGVPEPAPAGD